MKTQSIITLVETGEDIRLDTALRVDDAASLVEKYLRDDAPDYVKAMLLRDLGIIRDRVLGDLRSNYRHL